MRGEILSRGRMIWTSPHPQVKPPPPQPALGLTPLLSMGLVKISHWRWSWRTLRPLGWNLPWVSLTIPVPCMMDPLSNSLLLKGHHYKLGSSTPGTSGAHQHHQRHQSGHPSANMNQG